MSIDKIVKNAQEAFIQVQNFVPEKRAELLLDIAIEIENLGDLLLNTASDETNLPVVRFQGERTRTCDQLRMFARFIIEGNWQQASIDTEVPDRKPLPKSDIRSCAIPIGPIVVFGASNFPLAYSTCGGDTASALAAGCSVIYKAHPAHLKTSRLVASAIENAIKKHGYPPGIFQHFECSDFELIKELVNHPLTQGVGFTGSVKGGMAIYEYTKERRQPIPVFAEMGSVNPIWLLPNAIAEDSDKWANAYANAITMGVGQFCTNPGLIFGVKGTDLDRFTSVLISKIDELPDFKMLNQGIYQNYENRKAEVLSTHGVEILSSAKASNKESGLPTIAKVSSINYKRNRNLSEEVFGPFSMIVECDSLQVMNELASQFEGQLTTTIIFNEEDTDAAEALLKIMKHKAGRIILNGVPTGVEVCDSMIHGGPFPATTDGRFTSVGSSAILRWLRPICFQNCPDTLLPKELQNANPLGIWRKVNGQLSNAPL